MSVKDEVVDRTLVWPMRGYNNQRTGTVPDRFGPSLELAWKRTFKSLVWSGPIIADHTVYLPHFQLHALDLASGALKWQTDDLRLFTSNSPVVWQSSLVVCGLNGLYVVDARSGAITLHIPGKSMEQSPCIVGDVVYWVADTQLCAADLRTGEVRWRFDANVFRCIPAVQDTLVYIAGLHAISALDTTSGALVWQWPLPHKLADIRDTLVVSEGRLVAALRDYGLVAFDARSGELLWHYMLADKVTPQAAPCCSDGVVYVVSGELHAVDLVTGQRLWATQNHFLWNSAPIVVGEYLYAGGGFSSRVCALERSTGTLAWEYLTKDMVYSTPAYAQGHLVIGSHDRNLYCFREAR